MPNIFSVIKPDARHNSGYSLQASVNNCTLAQARQALELVESVFDSNEQLFGATKETPDISIGAGGFDRYAIYPESLDKRGKCAFIESAMQSLSNWLNARLAGETNESFDLWCKAF